MLAMLCSTPVAAGPLSAMLDHGSAIGLSTQFLKEDGNWLDLPDAVAVYWSGAFTQGKSPVLNFGMGSKAVWIRFSVDNPTAMPLQCRTVSSKLRGDSPV
jgi:hypothetical protein